MFTAIVAMCFSGCNNVDISNIVEEEAPDMIVLENWGDTSSYSGIWFNKFTVQREDGDIFFCYNVSESLHVGNTLFPPYSQIVLHSGETGYWIYQSDDSGHTTPVNTFIDIEIMGEAGNETNAYVGYAVIKVEKSDEYNYSASVIKSATFPLINGEAQKITKEQVSVLFNKARKN